MVWPWPSSPSPKLHWYTADWQLAVNDTRSGDEPETTDEVTPQSAFAAGAKTSTASAARAMRRIAGTLDAASISSSAGDGGHERDRVERRVQEHPRGDAVRAGAQP